jgi:hypothetical protein
MGCKNLPADIVAKRKRRKLQSAVPAIKPGGADAPARVALDSQNYLPTRFNA